jgi:hypothetical protein
MAKDMSDLHRQVIIGKYGVAQAICGWKIKEHI